MNVIVVIGVVYSLEQSLHLSDRPTVHRHQEHHSRSGPFTEFIRDHLNPFPRVSFARAGVLYPGIVQLPGSLQASHVVYKFLAVFRFGSVDR